MKQWPPQIERWRQIATWESRDVPVDLVLAVVKNESNGQPGAQSTGTTKQATIPDGHGGERTVNHALGLMQCTGATINTFNNSGFGSKQPATYAAMTGQQTDDCRMQIRVGSWVLASNFAALHRYFPKSFPSPSASGADAHQVALAVAAYAVGGNWQATSPEARGLAPKLRQLQQAGQPLTLAALEAAFPLWGQNAEGQWINRPLRAARVVSGSYFAHAEGAKQYAIQPAKPATEIAPAKPPAAMDQATDFLKSNWLILAALAAGLLYEYQKRQSADNDGARG